jgi:hypothetical protein
MSRTLWVVWLTWVSWLILMAPVGGVVVAQAHAQVPSDAPAPPAETAAPAPFEPTIAEPPSGEVGTLPPPEPPNDDAIPVPLPAPLPRSPPPPVVLSRRYGDSGTSEIALGLGYSTEAGLLAAGGFRYFVLAGVAPGLEASYFSGGRRGSALGLVLLALRVVPIRTEGVALVLTARGGRVLIADHADGWAAGGSGGVIVALGGGAGLEIGYEALRLLPASFCADLSGCVIHGPVLGLRLTL